MCVHVKADIKMCVCVCDIMQCTCTPPSFFLSLQKVDIYSVGIIFFEMCHPPATTAMERHKMLVEIRKKEINFPPSFDKEKQTQVCYCTYI